MIISETKDIKTLKRMHKVGTLHMARCLDEESNEYDPDRAAEILADLTIVKIRIDELS